MIKLPEKKTSFEGAIQEIAGHELRTLKLNAGQKMFRAGDSCNNFLIVAQGSIRASMIAESGREIVLYRVENGQSCVMTTACLFSGAFYDAEATVEIDTEAFVISKADFQKLIATSEEFRVFVFSSYGQKLHSLLSLVQEIVQRNLDKRLARFLIDKNVNQRISLTHQLITIELNSAREVISRLLHEFERKGWVQLARGAVLIIDLPELEEFANEV